MSIKVKIGTVLMALLFLSPMARTGERGLGVSAFGKEKQRIVRAVYNSVAGWNSRNLNRFIGIYEDSPDTMILLPRRMLRGVAAIRALYAARFARGDSASLGILSVHIMGIELLDADYALLMGRYRLMQSGKLREQGQTTLLFHRSTVGWRIVNDHSCPD